MVVCSRSYSAIGEGNQTKYQIPSDGDRGTHKTPRRASKSVSCFYCFPLSLFFFSFPLFSFPCALFFFSLFLSLCFSFLSLAFFCFSFSHFIPFQMRSRFSTRESVRLAVYPSVLPYVRPSVGSFVLWFIRHQLKQFEMQF